MRITDWDKPRLRTGVTAVVRGGAVAAVVGGLLVACGDDKDGGGVGGVDVASVEDFCSAMERVNVELSDSTGFERVDENRPDEVALQAVDSIEPPAEIADDWQTVVALTERAAADEDVEADEGSDEATAAEQVLAYVDVQCSVDLGSS